MVDAELTEVCVFAMESGGRFGAKATELMDLVARKSTSDKQLQAAFRRYWERRIAAAFQKAMGALLCRRLPQGLDPQ